MNGTQFIDLQKRERETKSKRVCWRFVFFDYFYFILFCIFDTFLLILFDFLYFILFVFLG